MSLVGQFYDQQATSEWKRLDRHRIKFAVALAALADHLPAPPAQILDVGGGPGRYAIALTQQGYAVTLLDLSAGCLALAQEQARQIGVELAASIQGDARDLSAFADASQDAVLLMGPLYHLLAEADRRQAVREAYRVLKPGGLVFATFITRYAPVRIAAHRAPDLVLSQRPGIDALIATGVVRADPYGSDFTDSYFAHVSEIRPLLEQAGFQTRGLVGLAGVIDWVEDKVNALSGEAWDAWVELSYQLGQDPSTHGGADDLLYIGQKPSA